MRLFVLNYFEKVIYCSWKDLRS